MSATFFSIVVRVKKFLEWRGLKKKWRGLKKDKRNMES